MVLQFCFLRKENSYDIAYLNERHFFNSSSDRSKYVDTNWVDRSFSLVVSKAEKKEIMERLLSLLDKIC